MLNISVVTVPCVWESLLVKATRANVMEFNFFSLPLFSVPLQRKLGDIMKVCVDLKCTPAARRRMVALNFCYLL